MFSECLILTWVNICILDLFPFSELDEALAAVVVSSAVSAGLWGGRWICMFVGWVRYVSMRGCVVLNFINYCVLRCCTCLCVILP